MEMSKMIWVEVAYARPDKQQIVKIEVPEGTTIEAAIVLSGLLELYPEIDLLKQKVGVFSKSRKLLDVVLEGDRIEIYRPLTIDPMEARRAKANQTARLDKKKP